LCHSIQIRIVRKRRLTKNCEENAQHYSPQKLHQIHLTKIKQGGKCNRNIFLASLNLCCLELNLLFLAMTMSSKDD
ncbi:TPA: hypothetical protein ACX6HA_002228, partial [Vibrio cholerae]